jgi:hypothetical protein
MAGHDVYYKKTKRERTIRLRQSTTTAILFSFPFVGVVQPTGWQETTSTTKERKENDQAATIDNNSNTRATINNNNLPLPRKSNNKLCVVAIELESNWSECTLQTNGVENIPPRINLGLECRND